MPTHITYADPPHWVPLPRLWEALQPHDPTTGRPRGYLLLSRPLTTSQGGGGSGPSLLFSLDKSRHAEWPALIRDWLLSLHLQQARSGMASGKEEGEETEEEGFLQFLAAVPPALATLIAPLPHVAAALAGQEREGGCGGASSATPQTALKQLIAAIEV